MRINVVQNNITPQGTWNLWWCQDRTVQNGGGAWCDCNISYSDKCEKCRMWKNSNLSNPIHHTYPQSPYCSCLGQGCLKCANCCSTSGAGCLTPNFGEMESLTCTLCTPQGQDKRLYTGIAPVNCSGYNHNVEGYNP